MSKEWLKNCKTDKLMQYETNNKVYCTNCNQGYGAVFKNTKTDRKLCRNCGHWIFRDKKTEIKYRMKERGINIED